jgi:hypothetical protein
MKPLLFRHFPQHTKWTTTVAETKRKGNQEEALTEKTKQMAKDYYFHRLGRREVFAIDHRDLADFPNDMLSYMRKKRGLQKTQ